MKYRSSMKKDDILKLIIDKFYNVNEKLKNDNRTERDWGEYIALTDLLKKIEIYEVESK